MAWVESGRLLVSRTTILIAPVEAIPTLRQQPHLHESRAFAPTDAALALEQIRRELPTLIAVERMFAATPPGQGFLRQIRSDESLAACQIRTVGVRQAPRHRVNAPVSIDGTPATLFDISVTGANVVGTLPIRPSQRLHLSMQAGGPLLTAMTVWVQYELPAEGAQYRAGVEFTASAAAAVADYVAALAR